MDKEIEQRICLKFCKANGISDEEALKMLHKAYGESTLPKSRAYESPVEIKQSIMKKEDDDMLEVDEEKTAEHPSNSGKPKNIKNNKKRDNDNHTLRRGFKRPNRRKT